MGLKILRFKSSPTVPATFRSAAGRTSHRDVLYSSDSTLYPALCAITFTLAMAGGVAPIVVAALMTAFPSYLSQPGPPFVKSRDLDRVLCRMMLKC
jgi:hypothetical protein